MRIAVSARTAAVAAALCFGCVLGAQTLTVSPSSVDLRPGQSKDFGASRNPVKWYVNGVEGGNATFGVISASGRYAAPASPPANPNVQITARTTGAPQLSADARVTLFNPVPKITSVTPNAVNVGSFSITVKGTGFLRSSKLKLGGAAVVSTFVSDTEIQARLTDNNARQTDLSVANPDPGGSESNRVTFRILDPVSVNVSPSSFTLRLNVQKKFGASVSNTSNRAVTWFVNNVQGGSPSLGTIDDAGLYTPPAAIGANPVTIRAVSVQDPTKSDSATVNLLNAIPVIAGASPSSLTYGPASTVTLTGTGFANGAVVLIGAKPAAIVSLTPTQLVARGAVEPAVAGSPPCRFRIPSRGRRTRTALRSRLAPSVL